MGLTNFGTTKYGRSLDSNAIKFVRFSDFFFKYYSAQVMHTMANFSIFSCFRSIFWCDFMQASFVFCFGVQNSPLENLTKRFSKDSFAVLKSRECVRGRALFPVHLRHSNQTLHSLFNCQINIIIFQKSVSETLFQGGSFKKILHKFVISELSLELIGSFQNVEFKHFE